jgi:hypothetical protein
MPRGPKGEKRHADLLVVVAHDETGGAFLDRPGRREAAAHGALKTLVVGQIFPCCSGAGLPTFARIGLQPRVLTSQDFAAVLADEVPLWKAVVDEAGVHLE